MRGSTKWAAGGLAGVGVLAVTALVAVGQWASSEDFRGRAQAAARQALGVPVQLGGVEVSYWPLGARVRGVQVQTRPAITLEQVEATPVWLSLLAGKPALDALVVRNAVLPQQGIVALAAAAQKSDAKAGAQPATPTAAPALPRRILLDQVTWVDAAGQKLTVNAEVAFGDEPLPRDAKVDITGGRYAGAKLRLVREDEVWQLRGEIGGGTIAGPLRLAPGKAGSWRLTGDLATDKVEVAALTAPSRSFTGRLEARTSLQADFKDPGQLADVLRTQTRFTVRGAVLHGVDLAAAVRTLGVSRDGQTVLDTLTGQVATQGKAVHLTNLVASSGMLSATGDVSLAADRSLSGKINAALGGSALSAGVPLKVAGTLDAPSVSPAGVPLPSSQAASSLGDKFMGLFK
jgi:hypothetical protein